MDDATPNSNEDVNQSFETHSQAALAYSYIQWLLDEDKKQEEAKKRATTITKVEHSINERSLMSHVIKVLTSHKEGLHINTIIDNVIGLGYNFKSKYHTYAQVYSIFASNPGMFMKTKRATFRLRNGLLRAERKDRPLATRAKAETHSIIPTKRDIIMDIVQTHGLNDPREVWYTMMSMGVSVSYDTVKQTIKEINHE